MWLADARRIPPIVTVSEDIRALVRQERFREDLYYRLNVLSITLPPLRQRIEDLPLLAEHFLRQYNTENDKQVKRLAPEVLQRLLAHAWPGNVRELENVVERGVVLARGAEITLDLLPEELYERLDRPALKPLPTWRFEIAEWKECGVNIDYHIEVDHNFYSVSHRLVRQRVEARFTASTVEVLVNDKRIAVHARLRGRGQYSTKPEHMPRSHRAHAEWTPSRLIGWADKAGPATGRVVSEILRSRPHPEQGYRSCLGLMRLGQRLGDDRLEQACLRAEWLKSYRYQTVKNILRRGLDKLPLEEEAVQTTIPSDHHNIRGASYYTAKETEC